MAQLADFSIIDADGHVLEPSWLWEEYLESEFKDRSIRIVPDDNGLEVVVVDGKVFDRLSPGGIALIGSMGEEGARSGPDRRYMESMPLGGCDPTDRLAYCDREGFAGVVLYPTIGLVWPCAVEDPALADAYARAYNRWIAEFCRGSGGRLIPIAQISMADPDLAAKELERAAADGCRGAFTLPFTWNRIPHGHAFYDPVWAAAERLGIPFGLHPGYEPGFANTLTRFAEHDSSPGIGGPGAQVMSNLVARHGMQQAFASFFAYNTLERFPGLRLGVLESGAGWVGSFLDRVDTLVEETMFRHLVDLKRRPSEYFQRQCFISCDPDETAAPLIVDHVGAHCFLWATDYPHPDHPIEWRHHLEEFVAPLSDDTAALVAGGNAVALYGIGS